MPKKKIRPQMWQPDELALIKAVKKYPIIHKKDYKSKDDAREKCWAAIAEEAGMSENRCKENWIKLRKDYFGTIYVYSRRKTLQFQESPLSFLNCSISYKIYNRALGRKKTDLVTVSDDDSLSDTSEEEIRSVRKPTLRSHTRRSLPQTSIPEAKEIPEEIEIARSHTTQPDEMNLAVTTEIKSEESDIDDTDANENNSKRFQPSSDTPAEFDIQTTSTVEQEAVCMPIDISTVKQGFLCPPLKTEPLIDPESKNFSGDLAKYITSKFSPKTQKDIQRRICALFTQIELDKLKAANQ
ncbi:uncharacterized protein LOC114354694 [Ostrinia furnacalis]|uniref:uncharacterized protein LOC114354694 n=1 Tax=Ostrinia furnacalis TaxID=93504 RepID=UPI00103DDF20|nr:uncharacterized protein LOC114354694 [Ostrinia furnacalis]